MPCIELSGMKKLKVLPAGRLVWKSEVESCVEFKTDSFAIAGVIFGLNFLKHAFEHDEI